MIGNFNAAKTKPLQTRVAGMVRLFSIQPAFANAPRREFLLYTSEQAKALEVLNDEVVIDQ
jgi:hypothetical protein